MICESTAYASKGRKSLICWAAGITKCPAGALAVLYQVSRDTINPAVWIVLFLIAIVLINHLGIKQFGEIGFLAW